ncbi:MAG: nucleotidyltransferase domain-containing protein [Planctomycetota bacterium]|jgi:predicted nucleotidyltransferase
MIDPRAIEKVATQIGIAVHAESVVLFGSHARGNAGEDSDVDLLIIAESDQPRHKRSCELYKNIRPYPFPMDLIVYTPGEIEKAKKSPVSFVSRILQEGKVVYDGRNRHRSTVGD